MVDSHVGDIQIDDQALFSLAKSQRERHSAMIEVSTIGWILNLQSLNKRSLVSQQGKYRKKLMWFSTCIVFNRVNMCARVRQ